MDSKKYYRNFSKMLSMLPCSLDFEGMDAMDYY